MFENLKTRMMNLMGSKAIVTEKQFFELEISKWKKSDSRKTMLAGENYYLGNHDILTRKRTVIGKDGQLQEVANLPNNQVVDNQYAKMVDQKVNYIVGKPLTFDTENAALAKELGKVFNKRFHRTLKNVCEDALNGGIGWLFPFYDDQGKFGFKRFEPFEILPFWSDAEHTVLDCAIRLYTVDVYEGMIQKTIEKVEIYTKAGIERYNLTNNTLTVDFDNPNSAYLTVVDDEQEEPFNWEKIPLIAFKYNNKETPLIKRVKSLQDGINTLLSDFQNNMQEDARNTILVISNYDGQDLAQFRYNLAAFGAVKVKTIEGKEGGVKTLTVEVNAENYKAILELFKKALIENARGYDAKDDRMAGSPNQMNIQSMYSDIDLDANGMETEFQASFEDLLWFVNQHLANNGVEMEDVDVIFNRDMLMNESESITNCKASVGILSTESIVSQHPWVDDVKKELKRLADEKKAAEAEFESNFGTVAIPGAAADAAVADGGVVNAKQ